MGTKTKKGQKGAVVSFMSRKKCLRHMQVSLPIFTRLCLLKDVYPVKPRSFKKAGGGDSSEKLYYQRNDINMLAADPLVEIMRQIRVNRLKIRKAKARGDKNAEHRLKLQKPRYNLFRLVKERFRGPEHAVSLVGEAIANLQIVGRLQNMTTVKPGMIHMARKMCAYWEQLVIAQRGIRRAFIATHSIVVESEPLSGVKVMWRMPHLQTVANTPRGVDYRLLATRCEFDLAHVVSVMRYLYQHSGLAYPPKFRDLPEGADKDHVLQSLAYDLEPVHSASDAARDEVNRDYEDNLEALSAMDENYRASYQAEQRQQAIQTLFKGKKVFLNREVPREFFSLLVRSCGGLVSWDSVLTHSEPPFPESDPEIWLQVVDRPNWKGSCMDRSYVKPQYLVDSLNAASLLPTADYAPDAPMIAHPSPFVPSVGKHGEAIYCPPELSYLRGEITAKQCLNGGQEVESDDDAKHDEDELVEESENEDDIAEFESDEESDEDMIKNNEDNTEKPQKRAAEASDEEEKDQPKYKKHKINDEHQKMVEEAAERKRKEVHIPKKLKNLYKKMRHAEKKQVEVVKGLTEKRKTAHRNGKKNKA